MSDPIYLCLFVTGKCNLNCPHCNQKYVMDGLGEYEISLEELDHIIASCQERNIHFHTIEFTGGEPSKWSHLEEGLKRLKDSGIADHLTLITNGNDAQRISSLATEYCDWYFVSVPQATPRQIAIHRMRGLMPCWNPEVHHPVPTSPHKDCVPAECVMQHTRQGVAVCHLMYIRGTVYYCCMASALEHLVEDPPQSYDFDDDFITPLSNRKFDQSICAFCLCNPKVWSET